MVQSLPVSVDTCLERRSPLECFEMRSDMVELIHGHSIDVLARLVEVPRCESR